MDKLITGVSIHKLIFLRRCNIVNLTASIFAFEEDYQNLNLSEYVYKRALLKQGLQIHIPTVAFFLAYFFRLGTLNNSNFRKLSSTSFSDSLFLSIFETLSKKQSNATEPISFIEKARSLYSNLKYYFKAKAYLRVHPKSELIIGHIQYHYRMIAFAFLENNLSVFALFGDEYGYTTDLNIYPGKWKDIKLSKNQTTLLSDPSQILSIETINHFTVVSSNQGPKNIVYVPILGDLPFYMTPSKRLFASYTHWLRETLLILNNSKEKWFFKVHPLSTYWGEDSEALINHFIQKFSPSCFNISILNSNHQISRGDRIISFRGTVALEAASLGVRSILIDDTYFSSLFPNMAIRPFTYDHYRYYLLEHASCLPLGISDQAAKAVTQFKDMLTKPMDKNLSKFNSVRFEFPTREGASFKEQIAAKCNDLTLLQ